MLNYVVAVGCCLLCCACSPRPPVHEKQAAHTLAPLDAQWMDDAFAATLEVAAGIGAGIDLSGTKTILFDTLSVLKLEGKDVVEHFPHHGNIMLPTGDVQPQILSFAAPDAEDGAFFVMALPSLWHAVGFQSPLPTETFTLGVFAHEISHVWQFEYITRIQHIPGVETLSAPVNDDMVQRIFEHDPLFSTMVADEIASFNRAAQAPNLADVRRVALGAREKMKARWRKHFVGSNTALAEAQAIFLTLEGAGQWFAIRVLTEAPSGPQLVTTIALEQFGTRGQKWSQDLGLAMARVLDRLNPAWPVAVYGARKQTLISLLDQALAE